MTVEKFVKSGMLELYCLGALSAEEIAETERMLRVKEVQEELIRIEEALENTLLQEAVQPPAYLKRKTQQAIYKSESGAGKKYPPFIDKGVSFEEIYAWAGEQSIQEPLGEEVIKLTGLPSTDSVINFLALVKEGHPEEWHDEYLEYIVVLEGSCIMDFEGKKVPYHKGEIIEIPLHVKHTASITSNEPMWALVQRQLV